MDSHTYQSQHYYLCYSIIVAVINVVIWLPNTVLADSKKIPTMATSTTMLPISNPPIETIIVTYRNAFDYALYQQTTEMLLSFNRDLSQSNLINVRQQSRQMAAEFGFSIAQSTRFSHKTKSLHSLWLFKTLQLDE